MWFILFGHVDELNRFGSFNYEHDHINLIAVFSLDATEGRFSWTSNRGYYKKIKLRLKTLLVIEFKLKHIIEYWVTWVNYRKIGNVTLEADWNKFKLNY